MCISIGIGLGRAHVLNLPNNILMNFSGQNIACSPYDVVHHPKLRYSTREVRLEKGMVKVFLNENKIKTHTE